MTTEASDQGRIRASDGEREEYARIVRAAMSEGRLTLAEGEDRLVKVYAARFRDELPPLTDDLPNGGRQPPDDADPAAAGGDPGVGERLRQRVRRRLGEHAAVFPAAVLVLVVVVAVVGPFYFYFFFARALPLLFLLLTVFVLRRIWFGRHWHGPRHHRWHAMGGCVRLRHGRWHPFAPWNRPWPEHGPEHMPEHGTEHGPGYGPGYDPGYVPGYSQGYPPGYGPGYGQATHGRYPEGEGWHR